MTTTDELLRNAEEYAAGFDKGDLPLPPARKVAVLACMDARLKSSSLNVSIPQSVWWTRMTSSVPSRRWEIASERISSSVTTPPALRMTCASPS